MVKVIQNVDCFFFPLCRSNANRWEEKCYCLSEANVISYWHFKLLGEMRITKTNLHHSIKSITWRLFSFNFRCVSHHLDHKNWTGFKMAKIRKICKNYVCFFYFWACFVENFDKYFSFLTFEMKYRYNMINLTPRNILKIFWANFFFKHKLS